MKLKDHIRQTRILLMGALL